MHLRGDAESLQDGSRARLQSVSVGSQDEILERRIAVAVEVGLGVGEDLLLLGHRGPERLVSHHDHVEDAHVLVLEMIL
ncbi:MAG: hypothetical protein ACX98W_13505, partial [bacterium]